MSDQSLALRGASSPVLPRVTSTESDAIAEMILAHTRPDGSPDTDGLAEYVAQSVRPEKLSGLVEAYLAEKGYSLFEIAHFSREVHQSVNPYDVTVDLVRPGLYKVTHSNGEIAFTDIPPRLSHQQNAELDGERIRYEAGKQWDEARRQNPELQKSVSTEQTASVFETSSDWFGTEEAHELLKALYGEKLNIPDAKSLNPETVAVAKQIFQDILAQSNTLHLLVETFVAENIPTPDISTNELVNLVYGESPLAPDLQPLVHSLRVFLQYKLGGGRESITDFLNSTDARFLQSVSLRYHSQVYEKILGL